MKHLLKKAICVVKGHDLVTVQEFLPTAKMVVCKRCKNRFMSFYDELYIWDKDWTKLTKKLGIKLLGKEV